jgi:hypothetical protein
MARTYKLDHFTKGTGANVVPVDDEQSRAEPEEAKPRRGVRVPLEPRRRPADSQRASTPLPPGHVRKKATGEIGKVQAVDPKAGTVTVMWLRRGASSTVPLASVTRR